MSSHNRCKRRRTIAILAGLSSSSLIKSTEARSWWSIDIPDIENIRQDDPVFKKSSKLLLEDTYFLFGPDDGNNGVDDISANTDMNFEADIGLSTPNTLPQWPYNSSLDVQLVSPNIIPPTKEEWPLLNIDMPTLSPSKAYQAENGGCRTEYELHRLWLYDSYGDAQYGDGWGTTTLQIRDTLSSDIVFEGTLDAELGAIQYVTDISMVDGHTKGHGDGRRLNAGEGNSVYLCLNVNACYIGELSGGTFTEECSWEVTKVELETGDNVGLVAKGVGGGSGMCEFGLADTCKHTCDGTIQMPLPTQSPTMPVPSKSPTVHPYIEPTESPTTYKTRRPTEPLP